MRFVIEPEKGIWVATSSYLSKELSNEEIKKDLRQRLGSTEVWFSDLDDCHADSPAKEIAAKAIGTNFTNLKYISWCLGTGMALASKGKEAESERWKKYVANFLDSPDARDQLQKMFTPEKVKASLYPGVEKFYSLLLADKYYITRNVAEVAYAYANVLGFRGVFSEKQSKGKIVEHFILGLPKFKNFGYSGDSVEDEEVVDVLKFYEKAGKIESSITIYRSDAPTEKKMNPKFDIQIGKDYRGLVSILA